MNTLISPKEAGATRWAPTSYKSGQIITTSAEVTLNGGLVGESSQNSLNSGLGIILICPELISGVMGPISRVKYPRENPCIFGHL